jgi:hypothetical protein
MAHIKEGKQVCDPIMQSLKCQATANLLSPIIVVA